MAWLLSRETMIVLAILGGLAATVAPMLRKRGALDELRAERLNYVGYALMAASMLIFIIAGFRAGPP